MKLTRREVTLLFLLGVVAVLYFGITYLVMPEYQNNMDKQATLDTLSGQLTGLNNANTTIDAQIGQAKNKSAELSKPFAGSIAPEQLDYWVDTLLKQNNLTKISSVYSDLTPAYPDFNKDKSEKTAKSGVTLQSTADAANGVPTPSPSPSASASPSAAPSQSAGTASESNANLNAPQSTPNEQPAGLNCVQLVLNVSGSYDSIAKFMDALYANGRSLIVDTLSVANSTTGGKTAAVTIRFFGVPLLDPANGQAYSFPSPAGQNVLMNAASTPAPSATPTPTPTVQATQPALPTVSTAKTS